MSTLAERLEQALKISPEKKAADLARACRVRAPSVSDWMSGKTKKMEGANLLLAAEFLDVDPWWLATGEGEMHRRPNSPSPHREVSLGASAQALIDAIVEADAQGVSAKAFGVLRETLSLFGRPAGANEGLLALDDPTL